VLVESDADGHPSLEVLPVLWQARAACVGVDPEVFFALAGHDGVKARSICAECPVLPQCRDYVDALEEGLGREHRFGIFAGESAVERWRRRRGPG
jgi:WhiB family redox-sensing transcriptional regulator